MMMMMLMVLWMGRKKGAQVARSAQAARNAQARGGGGARAQDRGR